MTFLEIMNIVIVILCGVTYSIMLYFKARGNLLEAVSELIALAEAIEVTGIEKMDGVVSALYADVPAPLKKILTRERIRMIAQHIFDWMRKYAETYTKAKEKENTAAEAVAVTVADATDELLQTLIGLSREALAKKAGEYGVYIDSAMKKEDIVRAIIIAVLNKA